MMSSVDKLSDIIRDYMKNYNTECEIEWMTEEYPGDISNVIQTLTQGVLIDLIMRCGKEEPDEENDILNKAYEVITTVLGKEFPCLGIDSWNDEVCDGNCKVKFACYANRSFNSLDPEKKRQWVLDQIKKGIQTFPREK
jgi:hypothetical protein